MAWKLDDNKPVYLQLIDEVKRRILAGEYKVGSKLPSVRELAMDAAVNPNTMQRALQDLEREGLIFAERTSGRFVTEDLTMVSSIKERFAQEIVEEFIKKMVELGISKGEIVENLTKVLNK